MVKPRRTAEDWVPFIEALREGKSISAAAARVGADRTLAYKRRERHPDFAAAWEDAIESGTDKLEDVATERAIEKSDWLLIQMLKARRPDKFGERVHVTERKEISWEPVDDASWAEKYGPKGEAQK